PRRRLEIHRRAQARALRHAHGRRRKAQRGRRARTAGKRPLDGVEQDLLGVRRGRHDRGAAARSGNACPPAQPRLRRHRGALVRRARRRPEGHGAQAVALPRGHQPRDGRARRNAPDAAIVELKKLIAANDRSYELHLFMGDAYAAKRQFESALGEYDAATVLNPHSSAPLVSQARVFLAMNELAKAQQKIDAAARIEPGSSEAAVVRGEILERLGRGPEALAQFDAAVRANGSDTQARASLASLAMRMRQYDVARDQFEKLLEMRYRPSRMQFGLAQIAEIQND